MAELQFHQYLIDQIFSKLFIDISSNIHAMTLSCKIHERLVSNAQYFDWANSFPRLILPNHALDISCVEQGLDQRFVLDRANFQQILQLPAIAGYALHCLGVTWRHLLISISTTLG